METSQLLILGQRDTGTHLLTSFGIVEGREEDAAAALVKLLGEGHEVSLANDLDEGGEGSSTFRRVTRGYARLNSGHGWQGDWTTLDESSLRMTIIALAPLNRGQHWSNQGTISCRK